MRRRFILALVVWCGLSGASMAAPSPQPLIEQYKTTLPRGYGAQAVLNAEARWQEGRIVLTGRALRPEDSASLVRLLTTLGPVDNRLEVFPYKAVGERAYAAVRAPGADLRAQPDASSELVSQALPGDTLKVLERPAGRWLRVLREWDEYVGWIEVDKVVLWTQPEWQTWRSAPLVTLQTSQGSLPRGSFAKSLPGEVPGPSGAVPVTGSIVTAEGKTYTVPVAALVQVNQSEGVRQRKAIVSYARALLADQPTRYLWGGTIGNALDCSGFNQTVYRLAGIALPRDSYQQQAASSPVAPQVSDWRQLQPGDLLFFSEKGKRATHTGIYIGEGKFIHSSGHNKGIAENNLLGESEYEQFLRRIYFGSGRVAQLR